MTPLSIRPQKLKQLSSEFHFQQPHQSSHVTWHTLSWIIGLQKLLPLAKATAGALVLVAGLHMRSCVLAFTNTSSSEASGLILAQTSISQKLQPTKLRTALTAFKDNTNNCDEHLFLHWLKSTCFALSFRECSKLPQTWGQSFATSYLNTYITSSAPPHLAKSCKMPCYTSIPNSTGSFEEVPCFEKDTVRSIIIQNH